MVSLTVLVLAIASAAPDVQSTWGKAPPTSRDVSLTGAFAYSIDDAARPLTPRSGQSLSLAYAANWNDGASVFGFGFRVLGDFSQFYDGPTPTLRSISVGGQLRFSLFNGPVRPYLATGGAL